MGTAWKILKNPLASCKILGNFPASCKILKNFPASCKILKNFPVFYSYLVWASTLKPVFFKENRIYKYTSVQVTDFRVEEPLRDLVDSVVKSFP